MLSRVAESLYWMARYIERAEAVARLAAVDFQALLDGTRRGRLEDVVRITSDAALFRTVFPSGEEAGVLEFLHAHPANPSGVLVCLSRARENARGMREQISSEMWEHLNRLYLLARDGRAAAMEEGPYAFFRQVRDGTQAFEGITAATMTHAPAYEFIQLGRYLERAVVTIRTLAVRYEDVCMLEDGSAPASLELITLLKSCGAFEPFRRQPRAQLRAGEVAEYLLLNPQFPRAVLFCLERIARALWAVAPPAVRADEKLDPPARLVGRLRADLDYLDVPEVLHSGLSPLLEDLLRRVHQVGNEVTRTYFNTRVILPTPRASAAAQQQQQQQQQQARA
jgi:uncharacterized alpha-E superfamily protein